MPVLAAERVTFKIAASPERVAELNQGIGGIGQAGKFLTAYPQDAEQAVRVATALDGATKDMRGPRVLTDRALSPSSLVHYRFSDYVLRAEDEPVREAERETPDDPFVAAGIVPEPKTKLIAGRYLITANLHRSIRGAVHLAVDAIERRTCVLKRAWRDAAFMPDGTDARDRLRVEAETLRSLQPDDHFPLVWDVVEDDDDLFMVMEHVQGRPFAQVARGRHADGAPPGTAEIATWGIELAAALERIHARGLVHRDLNPGNVIVGDDGSIHVVDFELAQRQGARPEGYGAGTAGYMSPGQAASEPAKVQDDLFGLGALLYLAATGDDPPPDVGDGSSVDAPRPLAEVIAACLSFDDERALDAARIRMDLERALRG
ncbi:MAG TPA: protein kinase [Actinomycetota bacterium]